jgi:quinol monooxygenase YgiN
MTLSPRALALALLALAACGGSSSGGGTGASGTTSTIPDPPGRAGCSRGVVEADLQGVPLQGSGVDPTTHQLSPLPATAVMSSTYLALRSDADSQKLFGSLVQTLLPKLGTQPGLLGFMLGTSASCGTARTLTVWKDEASMVAFATGSTHSAAAAHVGDVSRGGSVVTTWTPGGAGDATWAAAARELAAQEGASY